MRYKAVAIDIDGTITFNDRRLDCLAVEALRSICLPVVIATGNILCFARTTSKLIGTGGILIAENGGVVECGRVEYDISYMKECEEALEFLRKHFKIERIDFEYRRTEICLQRDFDIQEAGRLLVDFPNVRIMDTGFAIHILSRSVNKGTGLVKVARMMGLDAKDFVAIGDSPNDIEIIRAAGFGVAVGNAHPELKKAADMVTDGEFGAGVAEAVRRLMEKGMIR